MLTQKSAENESSSFIMLTYYQKFQPWLVKLCRSRDQTVPCQVFVQCAFLHRWMLLPLHQIGVAKQPGKWLQLVEPFLQKKKKSKHQNPLNSVAWILWCNVACDQGTKPLQGQACRTEDYFSQHLIQLNVLKLCKWVYDGAWAPLPHTEMTPPCIEARL